MADASPPQAEDFRLECAETSPVVRSLRIEVDADRVREAFDRAYGELRKTARVKGFRPGKVPRSVLERMYGASMPDEVERVLVSETLAAAIERAELSPVSEPDIDAERPEPGGAFRYTARVEVKPEFSLPDLAGLKGRRPAVRLDHDEVDQELERIRNRQARLIEEPEGTEAANEHVLTLDFEGRIDGEPFPGGSAKGVDIQLGSDTMVPGFEEQLVGARAGDDREVRVTFPDDYGPAELNGREAAFSVHVIAVRRRELPELDDELAKDVGDFDSLDALREKLATDRRRQKEEAAESALRASLMESLIGLSDFEVPAGIVDRQLQRQLRSMHDQFHGRVPHEVLHQQLRRMQEEGRPVAERRVREMLLIEKIIEEQGISASQEDVDARLAEMAGGSELDLAKLRATAESQGWLHAIEHELLEQRAFAWLAEQATIEDVGEEPEEADGA